PDGHAGLKSIRGAVNYFRASATAATDEGFWFGSGSGGAGLGSQKVTVGRRTPPQGPRDVIARTISRVTLNTRDIPLICMNRSIFSSFTVWSTSTVPTTSIEKVYGIFRSGAASKASCKATFQLLRSVDNGVASGDICKSSTWTTVGFCE